jgi:hypothetical protein
MATTEITQSVKDITGISSLSTHSIEDGQRFVVSSIPKDLLTYAQTQSDTYTGGGGIAVDANENIVDVQRNGYSCRQIPISESKWAGDSGSLKYATAKHPVYWMDASVLKILPEPSGVEDGYYYFIDYTRIDDKSDLRNAVTYRVCSLEFTKLASGKITDWVDVDVPVAPASPSFGSDLTISVSAPVVPIITASTVDASGWTSPSYTKPVLSITSNPSIADLNISSFLPVSPASPSFTYTDASVSDIVKPLIAISDMAALSASAPGYTKPVVSLEAAPTITDLSVNVVAPVSPPVKMIVYNDAFISDILTGTMTAPSEINVSANAPTYSKPVFAVPTLSSVGSLTLPSIPVKPNVSAQSVTITGIAPTYVKPVVSLTSFPATSWVFPSPPVRPQVSAQVVADFSSEAPTYTRPVFSSPTLGTVGSLTLPSIPVPPSSPSFTYDDVTGISDIVEPLISISDMSALSASAPTYTKPVVSLQDIPTISDLTITASPPVAPTLTDNSVSFSQPAPTYTGPVVSPDFAQVVTYIDTEEDVELASAKIREIDTRLNEFQGKIQNELNTFNKENAAYQAELQVAIQNAQLDQSDESMLLQKYSNDLQKYQAEVSKEVQEYQQNLEGDTRAWQAGRQTDLQKYGSDIQNELNEFNRTNVIYQEDIQRKNANLQKEIQQAVQNAQNAYTTKKANLDKNQKIAADNALQNFQEGAQLYQSELSKYQAEVSSYQAETNSIIQKWVNEEWTQNFEKYRTDYDNLIKTYTSDMQNSVNDFNKEVQIYQATIQKNIQEAQLSDSNEARKIQNYQQEISSYSANVSRVVQGNQAECEAWQKENATAIQKYGVDIQNSLNVFNKESIEYTSKLQKDLKDADLSDGNESKKIQLYQAELTAYQTEVGAIVQKWVNEEWTQSFQKYQTDYGSLLQEYQSNIQNELNEFNKENARYQIEFQEAVTKANHDMQEAVQNLQVEIDVKKTNLQKDQANVLQNAQNQMQALIADNNSKFQVYQTNLQNYQFQVTTQIQEYDANLRGDLEVWQAERSTDLQKFASDIQNELNDFNKDNVVYQEDIQRKAQNLQKDIQEAVQNAQNDIAVSSANLNKDVQIDLQNAVQDFQQDVQEYSAKLQKYSGEVQSYQQDVNKQVQEYTINEIQKELAIWNTNIQSDLTSYTSNMQNELNEFNKELQIYQAEVQASVQDAQLESTEEAQKIQKYSAELNQYQQDINKEIQDYTNTLSKNVQEYQNKIALYTADVQKFQASVGNQAQKTTMTAQQAQHYQAEADKYYKWSVNEVSSYIANNSKMIDRTMAAQVAAQQQ